jgi:hypothetical protein
MHFPNLASVKLEMILCSEVLELLAGCYGKMNLYQIDYEILKAA